MSPQRASPIRLQGCFVSDKEIRRLTDFWRAQGEDEEQGELFPPWMGFEDQESGDGYLEQARQIVETQERVSASYLQRQLRIGFPRAARLIDQLEAAGLVGPDEGGGRGREVLVGKGIDFDEIDERLPGVEPK
jgi:S-DNA-T family DNA segregation ATPase FtsK/SpoIIIE